VKFLHPTRRTHLKVTVPHCSFSLFTAECPALALVEKPYHTIRRLDDRVKGLYCNPK
jgi:hypothetical protein